MIIMMDQIIHFGFCPVGFIPPTIRMKVTMMIPELMRRRMEAMVISQFLPNFILNMLKRYDKSIYSKNIGVQAHTPCTFAHQYLIFLHFWDLLFLGLKASLNVELA